MQSYRSLFLSDLHFRTKWCQAERLLRLLRDTEAETLYLVGDIEDNWIIQAKRFYISDIQLACINEITNKQRFPKLVYVNGNHDQAEKVDNGSDIFNTYHTLYVEQILHTRASGEKILVVHGHQFDHKFFQHFHEISLYRWFYEQLTLHRKNKLYGYIEKVIVNILRSDLDAFSRRAMQYAKDYHVKTIITGHTHHPTVTMQDGIWFMNTGDWVTNCSYIAETDDGTLSLLYEKDLHCLH